MNFHQVPTVSTINCLKNAGTAELTVYFKKLKLRHKMATQHLWFNKQCVLNKIKPSYINVRIKSTSRAANIVRRFAENKWIKEECRRWYAVRDNTSLYLKVIYSELAFRLHPAVFDSTLRDICETVYIKIQATYEKQSHKLAQLKAKQGHLTSTNIVSQPILFYDKVLNLSEVTFSEKHLALLNKSLKHCPTTNIDKRVLEQIAVDLDVALGNDITHKHICADLLRRSSNNNQPCDEVKSVKHLKRILSDENLIVTKADKGNTTVVLTILDYKAKIYDFINSGDFTTLRKDPTTNYQQQIRSIVNSSILLSESEKYFSINMNPMAPVLYGLPKTHKPNVPIRPVVSYINAPAYKLSKKVIALFLSITKFQPCHTIINSYDLINKIQNQTIPHNAKLVSFDVCNLFSKIPINKCKEIITDIIWSSKAASSVKNDLELLMFTCLEQNYFNFDNTVFKQNDGVAMGSPLSPLLADIYMDYFESVVFRNTVKCSNILYWFRYVDDILCLWTGTDRQLDIFLNYINSIENNIKFTLEVSNNQSINFLDLSISIQNNKHSFKVFRKDTYSDAIIHSSSNHPMAYKHAAFNSMVHRLVTFPLNKSDFEYELRVIKQIASNNGYDSSLIDKILYKKTRKLMLAEVFPQHKDNNENTKFCRINFVGGLSLRIARQLRLANYRPVFYTGPNLRCLLGSNKPKIDPLRHSGVYKLSCNDCSSIYVGQTGRSFATRCKEHSSVNSNSNFSLHLREKCHTFTTDNVKILHFETKGRRMNALESLEINRFRIPLNNVILLNDQMNLSMSPLLQPIEY